MGLMSEVKLTWEAFLDLVYPPGLSCIICKGKLDTESAYGICSVCLQEISFTENKRWMQASYTTEDGRGIRMFSAVAYKGEIKKLIYALKYKHNTYLSREMAEVMKDFLLAEAIDYDIIIPVPLYHKKKRRRGFNQAALLAKYLGSKTGVEVDVSNLIRTRNTRIMHQLSRMDRRENVRGAFQLKKPNEIFNKSVLLIDDILTTGSTIEECGKILYGAGAEEVIAMTFARGILDKE